MLYGGSGNNVFASAQELNNGAIAATRVAVNNVLVTGTTVSVCRNQALRVWVTIGNNGTVSSTSGFRVFLSTTPNGYTGGWNMWTSSWTAYAQSQFTQALDMNVPNINPGKYYILWQIDTGNTQPEVNESDNAVHCSTTLQVLNC